jgi:hypothetical protein
MKMHILFIFGVFENHEDIVFFCTEVISETIAIKSIKYVIENSQNIIIIFDSDLDKKELSYELHHILTMDVVKFYFMFELNSLITAHLPEQIKDFIYKPQPPFSSLEVNYIKNNDNNLDLNEVLDKIEKIGINGLTDEEKKFLDNFDG